VVPEKNPHLDLRRTQNVGTGRGAIRFGGLHDVRTIENPRLVTSAATT
jgi:hypothetical protein